MLTGLARSGLYCPGMAMCDCSSSVAPFGMSQCIPLIRFQYFPAPVFYDCYCRGEMEKLQQQMARQSDAVQASNSTCR